MIHQTRAKILALNQVIELKNVVSVERMSIVPELLSEAPHELLDKKPPCERPTAGQVQFL